MYGGGGNLGAIYNADFIELHNRSRAPVSLNPVTFTVETADETATAGLDYVAQPAQTRTLAGVPVDTPILPVDRKMHQVHSLISWISL